MVYPLQQKFFEYHQDTYSLIKLEQQSIQIKNIKQTNRKKQQKSIVNKDKRVNRKKLNRIKRKKKLKIELNNEEIVIIIQKLLF